MSGVVRVEWPARLICSIATLRILRSRLRANAAVVLDAAEFVSAYSDLEFAEERRRPADDGIAGVYRADALRRAGIDEVARIERIERRGEFDQAAAVIDQHSGVALLPDFAVDLERERQRIGIGDFVGGY